MDPLLLYWKTSIIYFRYNRSYKIKMTTQLLENIISFIAISLGFISSIGAFYLLIQTVTSKKGNLFNLKAKEGCSEIINSLKKGRDSTTLGMEELAKYYTEITRKTKISFWFSWVFALFGLSILLIITYSDMELNFGKIIVSFISITIIEAVSLLFILKSNKSQKEIEQFVENLGEDN